MSESIVLASASPRRAALLDQIGIRYTRVEVAVDETPLAYESPSELVGRLACAKAAAGVVALGDERDEVVLGADTVVVLDGRILGKPVDEIAAAGMLRALSGRRHEVRTAVALARRSRPAEVLESVTLVEFRVLGEAEIERYCASGEPLDKAGAYAIQGRGAVFVTAIEGSYSGVVGLPLAETATLLGRFGVEC